MIRFKFVAAFCLGLALVGTTTAHAQSAVLFQRTLTLSGTNFTDVLEVLPNTSGNGYVVELNGLTRPIFNANVGENTNSVASSLVDSIEIVGGSGDDFLFLGRNFNGDTVLDVNANLDITMSGGSGNDTIDPGVTGLSRNVFVFGGWGFDTLHSYYTVFGRFRLNLSPPMLDMSRMDRIESHRVGANF